MCKYAVLSTCSGWAPLWAARESCPSADGTTSRLLLAWPGYSQSCFLHFSPSSLIALQLFFVLSETHFPWGALWGGCGTQLCPAVRADRRKLLLVWGSSRLAPWYLGRGTQSRGSLTAAEHQLMLYSVILKKKKKKGSSEKGICDFSPGHRWQNGSDQRWGTCALHFCCACWTPWSFPQALHGVSFSWVALKHRNVSGLKERLNDESVGIAAVSSSVGRRTSLRAQAVRTLMWNAVLSLGWMQPGHLLWTAAFKVYLSTGQAIVSRTWNSFI